MNIFTTPLLLNISNFFCVNPENGLEQNSQSPLDKRKIKMDAVYIKSIIEFNKVKELHNFIKVFRSFLPHFRREIASLLNIKYVQEFIVSN